MADFIEIVNCIFLKKESYNNISDDDKINSFFIINRKFGKQYPDIAKKFNNKYIDKASSIDLWFNFFKNERKIPQWYWDNPKKKSIKTVKKSKYDSVKNREELKNIEMEYLEKYYEKELVEELKKINKFE